MGRSVGKQLLCQNMLVCLGPALMPALCGAPADHAIQSQSQSLFFVYIYDSTGPRLLQLRYKWTVATYRMANIIFSTKLLWRSSMQPVVKAHAKLARKLHPVIRQLLGTHVSAADAQVLAQTWAWVLPVAAVLLLLIAWRASRRQR